MIFRSIEKPTSAEENKIEEESMGGPWDKHYEEQLDTKKEEKKEWTIPKGEHPLDKIKEKKWKSNPLSGISEEQIEELLKNLKKQEKSPVSDWEYEKLIKKVKKRRDSQAEI